MVPNDASRSPLNIGYDKSDDTIIAENHISPKHDKAFNNFILKLLCFDKNRTIIAQTEIQIK